MTRRKVDYVSYRDGAASHLCGPNRECKGLLRTPTLYATPV
jgi:hypothetical protein